MISLAKSEEHFELTALRWDMLWTSIYNSMKHTAPEPATSSMDIALRAAEYPHRHLELEYMRNRKIYSFSEHCSSCASDLLTFISGKTSMTRRRKGSKQTADFLIKKVNFTARCRVGF
jgi:hypothetical protein